ncbi:hypothetical protein GCM10029964_093670 [Kibdelosporangium lantanae]
MDNEKPGNATPPPPKAEPAVATPATPTPPKTPDPPTDPSRDDALNKLRPNASKLSGVRSNQIAAEGLDGVGVVNIFHGDFTVDGDFTAGGAGRRGTPRRAGRITLDPAEVAARIEYFVPPPGFADGVLTVLDQHLVFLSGPGRTGRYTRGLATLWEALRQAQPDAAQFELNSSVLGNLGWRPPGRSGLLVVDRPKNGKCLTESVTDEWLTRAADRLTEQGSYLVVVTGPVAGTLATASRGGEFVVDAAEPPDPFEVVRRRVLGEMPYDTADLADRLVTAGLPDLLADRDDPAFATRAAKAVVDALRAGTDLADVVARLSNAEEQVHEWLEGEPDLAEVAFVFTTAVLEGATYLSVADAAVTLYRQIGSASGVLTPRYLRSLRGRRDWITFDGQVLRFKHARLRQVVLAVVWSELDGARDKILAWLRDLASHTDVEVRARAAQAAGILAGNDFEHAVHRYLMPWGADSSPVLQQSAAIGLNVAAATLPERKEAAWGYIEQWADLVNSTDVRDLPATAGLAAGGQLGVESPRRALRLLYTLVREDDWDLLEPVAISTQTLLEAGRADEVFAALLEWTESTVDEITADKALMMFTFAITPETTAAQERLLRNPAVPRLWSRALARTDVRPFALEALRSWLRIVDDDGTGRDTVLLLLADIADHNTNNFDRLISTLERWATDPNDPSKSAALFHDQLLDASEEPE